MENTLKQLNLEILLDRFNDEHIEPQLVESLSDEELVRLGVKRMGDRVVLRDLCKRVSAREPRRSPSPAKLVLRERELLFNPRANKSSGSSRASKKRKTSSKAQIRRPWTGTFFCLASRHASTVPTPEEKQKLNDAGLGLKKVRISSEDGEEEVLEKLTSSEIDETTGEPTGFPQLSTCGGFELLRCNKNCKDMKLIDCTWSAKKLKQNLGSQCKIFIRPIQKSIAVRSSSRTVVEELASQAKNRCNWCRVELPVRQLRQHVELIFLMTNQPTNCILMKGLECWPHSHQ